MKLSELVEMVDGVEWSGEGTADPPVDSITVDSREVEPGALFVALVGEEFDGHRFVDEAVDAGAGAVFVEEGRFDEFDWRGPTLEAPDTRRALGPLAAALHGHPSRRLEVVGVTGTNGKTTTTYILESIFRAAGRTVGRIGTVDYRWNGQRVEGPNTTPGSAVLQRLLDRMGSDGVETVVMEVSSHGLATHRLRGTDFDCGLFTNFSQDHLDFHGDLETYRAVKRSFFTEYLSNSAASTSPVAVLNGDDETGRSFARDLEGDAGVETRIYRRGPGRAEVSVKAESQSLTGAQLCVDHEDGQFEVESPLLGEFNVENVAAAVAAALAQGVGASAVARGVERLEPIPGRLERVGAGEGAPAVFVDYAHSPDALRRVLETLRPLTPGELMVVFGCGGDRDREKRPRMGEVAEELADRSVLTSDNPRSEAPEAILEDVWEGISEEAGTGRGSEEIVVEVDRERAIERAIAGAGADDVVLIAGKGHEQYQEIDGTRRPFDDRERAKRALESTR